MKRFFLWILAVTLILCACTNSLAPTEPTKIELPETTIFDTTISDTTADTQPPKSCFDPYTIIESMSDEALVGQLFLARCPDINAASDAARFYLGGYVLFGRDFKSKSHEDVKQTIASYQAASSIPMLIAVDEEGGIVNRVSSQKQFRETKFPSPRKLFAQGGLPLILETEREKCALLLSLGINVNLAPVCDITTDPDAFMYSRSLGESPEITGQYIAAMVQTIAEEKMGCVLKHFPGYGNSTDTHTGIAVDRRTLEHLISNDLVPFSEGIRVGAKAIMVSHVIIEALDSTMPATLSAPVHEYLRKEMGFTGVIITDDLVMQAVTDLYGAEEAAILAILAGNDMLIASEYTIQYNAILQAVRDGRISRDRITESVARILQWKYDLGLIEE